MRKDPLNEAKRWLAQAEAEVALSLSRAVITLVAGKIGGPLEV